jgi:hypothetical protein
MDVQPVQQMRVVYARQPLAGKCQHERYRRIPSAIVDVRAAAPVFLRNRSSAIIPYIIDQVLVRGGFGRLGSHLGRWRHPIQPLFHADNCARLTV